LALFGFALVSFLVLFVGMLWPSKFETSAPIYADNQNILGPLLKDQAEQSKIQDQTKVVREKLYSPRLLTKVAKKLYGPKTQETPASLTNYVNAIRKNISVSPVGSGYMRIKYFAETPDEAYQGLNGIIDIFIRESADEQRSESREAFLFIDNQVNQYKEQLIQAESRLKEFASSNFDGRDSDVSASIRRLRDQIEELKISIDEDITTVVALKAQLEDESEFSGSAHKVDGYTQRLQELEVRLNTLLLSYTEDYPDVVSLRYQIEDVKRVIADAAQDKLDAPEIEDQPQQGDDTLLNPLYQELRSRLSQAQTDIKAKRKRLTVLNGLLEKEFERRTRVAERGAEEAELNRDYSVTKRIYEDMLERKEKARLSMTLNIEGQGVTYRIQEPPLPPLMPTGLRFLHFILAGPFVGLLLIIGLAVAYVLVDPRIRFSSRVYQFDVPVLAVIPHVNTPLGQRIMRTDIIVCSVLAVLTFAVYLALAFAYQLGFLL
jgi:polysaccharide chain length determinant protein (PEP-CTERM system associated)